MELYDFDISIEKKRNCCIVGTDEAGRGPLAGPVVAAAVRLDLANPIKDVYDSKKISKKKREELYSSIVNRAISWAVGHATPAEIDKLNILQASLLAMKRALEALDFVWSLVLIDGNKIVSSLSPERQQAIVGGDKKSASIAAASILAKVTRDRLMDQYHYSYPQYGFNMHKGYPTNEHRKRVLQYGLCPIHRKSFCEKLLVSQTEMLLL